MADKVLVTCNNSGSIPGLGWGPVKTPALITVEDCQSLKDAGYSIEIHGQHAETTVIVEEGGEGGGEKTPRQEAEALTVTQLKAELTERNVEFANNAKKAELVELLLADVAKQEQE